MSFRTSSPARPSSLVVRTRLRRVTGACVLCLASLTSGVVACSEGSGTLEQRRDEDAAGGAPACSGVGCSGATSTLNCPGDLEACGGRCLDLTRDASACGRCDNECSAGQLCVDGECAASCHSGETACDRACVDLQTSALHCGACGNVCAPGLVCDGGQCACPLELSACGPVCVNLTTSQNHCGVCDNRCPEGQVCAQAECVPARCTDACGVPGGVEWGCARRFMYGMNYAWHNFGGDFGGISKWGQQGVAMTPEVATELADMASLGARVVRWWVWPDFRGDGVRFDSANTPLGLGGSAVADLNRALELAEENDLYLMPCLFSFDGFGQDSEESGPGLRGLLRDPRRWRALLEDVVRPFARAVAESPARDRVLAWDVINEPEWAMEGPSLYGDDDFGANEDLEPVSHAEMEKLVNDVIRVLRQESSALMTVGSAAMKWRYAWSRTDIDFYQLHTYDWVNRWWPYEQSPADYGLTDRPIVMGEFPPSGLTNADGTHSDYSTIVESWFANGYAGALSWSYSDPHFGSGDARPAIQQFAATHACETRY